MEFRKRVKNVKRINKRFWVWNLEEEKAFLEEKAREGLILKSISLGGYTFEESEPKDLIYQMDFKGLDRKISEDEYIQLYEDAGWNLAGRSGGWYYFSQESSEDIDLLIFNDNASKASIYKRLLAFLLITGFPLYYQIIFFLPNLSSNRLDFPNIYFFFRIIVVLIAILHLSALVKIFRMYKKTISDIKE
jgi:hypothetical protein